jgi:preprotein translocase subunit YajC
LHSKKIWTIGIIAGLLAGVALLAGCYPATTDTGTDGTTSSSSSFLIMIGFIVILFALMYFLTIRPQRKRQQEQAKMIQELHRGDKVVTIGGLMGTVESVSEDSIVIRVDSGATMRFVKSAIATKVAEQQPQTGS